MVAVNVGNQLPPAAQDVDVCRAAGNAEAELGPGLATAAPDVLARVAAAATAAVDALMQSDAPLLHPPGQLALAALCSGCRRRDLQSVLCSQVLFVKVLCLPLYKCSPAYSSHLSGIW